MPTSAGSRAETERQLAAAAERHREAVTSMEELGRPEAGQHVAIKSVGRAVHLVSFALRRAADAGVEFDRLVELTGWQPDLVREGLQRPVPEPKVIARLAPAGVDAHAVARAAASFEAIRHLHELTERVLADVDPETDAQPPVEAADLEAVHDRLESAWNAWRQLGSTLPVELHPAMAGHLAAVTQDAERLRAVWADDGVLEFPYAPPEMTSRIEGVDDLVAYFDGPRRWGDWHFEPVQVIEDAARRLHVAEIHATARWLETDRPYVQDYVIWMTLDEAGRIRSWREYWDKARLEL